MKNKNQYSIEDLLDVMSELRNKCPWDKEQTLDTLKKLTIEETYELVDAIDKKKYDDIKDELGDLLLHVIFYSKIASENKKFNFYDVLNSLIEKLIYRHPHIYGDIKVSSIDEVKKNWERLKVKDKNKGILSGVPNHLPSLIKAHRVQDKVASIGFDFPNVKHTIDKIKEEFEEFSSALLSQNKSEIEEEFGDILFSLINYSRHIGIDSDESLNKSIQKFINRFNKVEKILKSKNLNFDNCSDEELNNFWNEVKK